MLRLLRALLIAALLFPCRSYAQHQHEQQQQQQKDEDQTQSDQQQQPTDQATAATPAEPQAPTVGPTAFVEIQGARSSLGVITLLDIDLGYQLTEHWSGDIGLPIYYYRSPHSLVTAKDWETDTLLGEPYLDIRYTRASSGLKFESIMTGTAPPSAGPERTFTTGRFGVDWFNHVEPAKSFMNITPFLNFGAASQTTSRYHIPRPYSIGRPYQTLGFMSDFEGGLSYRFLKDYQIGGSFYALVPGGRQKMFSRIVLPGSAVVGDGAHNRYFDAAYETIGQSKIAKDNGYSAWADVVHFKNVTIQVGYTRSVHYHYDSASVSLKLNATELMRQITGTTGR